MRRASATFFVVLRLRTIIESAKADDPFTPRNAVRLNHMGWLLLIFGEMQVALTIGKFLVLGAAATCARISKEQCEVEP